MHELDLFIFKHNWRDHETTSTREEEGGYTAL